jgi:hypothetical protein
MGQDVDVNKLIAWVPLDPISNALKQLVEQREMVKQTIYEVTGFGHHSWRLECRGDGNGPADQDAMGLASHSAHAGGGAAVCA